MLFLAGVGMHLFHVEPARWQQLHGVGVGTLALPALLCPKSAGPWGFAGSGMGVCIASLAESAAARTDLPFPMSLLRNKL